MIFLLGIDSYLCQQYPGILIQRCLEDPSQISKKESFVTIVNSIYVLAIAKKLSILDICGAPGQALVIFYLPLTCSFFIQVRRSVRLYWFSITPGSCNSSLLSSILSDVLNVLKHLLNFLLQFHMYREILVYREILKQRIVSLTSEL